MEPGNETTENTESTEPTVRENDQVKAQENGDAVGSKNDETQAMQDQRAEYVHDPEVHGRDYRVEGNDVRDYIGVDPEYMTYANATEAPGLTDVERFQYTSQYDHLEGNMDGDLPDSPEGDSEYATAPPPSEDEYAQVDHNGRLGVFEGQLEQDPSEYDAKVDITKLSDDEILALDWKDEDGDGRDDDTGLHETDFKYMQLGAKERKEHPETAAQSDGLDFPA